MVPYVYRAMEPEQIELIEAWFADTEERSLIGETSIPAISLITSLITSSSLSRVVQLGHYAGYSTLMIGFAILNSRSPAKLASIDLESDLTEYTAQWVERAGLGSLVSLYCGDSSDPELANQVVAQLGGGPDLIFLDSSHAYAHTLEELDLWYPLLVLGGLILLHDVSEFATEYDATGQGGVRRALDEWGERNDADIISINRTGTASRTMRDLVYQDGCGLGIIQKPFDNS